MRQPFAVSLMCLALFAGAWGYTQIVANSRYLDRAGFVLRAWSLKVKLAPAREADTLAATRARVHLYEKLIHDEDHLVDGMLVNRSWYGRTLDQCDSLLFSSIRYIALGKLGMPEAADEAWRAIEASQSDGHWQRHPRCATKPTSRDMIMGLLMALSQQPPGYEIHMAQLFERIKRHSGFFSDGPVYVSYVTPTVAKLMALLAPTSDIAANQLPYEVRNGYSTNEWSMLVANRGYQSHLIALAIWLELEIKARHPMPEHLANTITEDIFERLVASPFSTTGLRSQRLEWQAHRLVQMEPRNLFFRYLRLRAAGAMTPDAALYLLSELNDMSQFPVGRLPESCDRRADYLWQRAGREYRPAKGDCMRRYNGADYLWMAGLLIEEIEQPTALVH